MPICKRRPHILELINIGVDQRKKIMETRKDLILRQPSMWYLRKAEAEAVEGKLEEEKDLTYISDDYSKPQAILLRAARNTRRWSYFFYKKYHRSMFTVSVHSQRIYSHLLTQFTGLLLWPLALTVLLHFAPKTNGYEVLTEADKALYTLDIVVNTLFLIITVLNIAGTLIRYKIEKVYNRPQTWSKIFMTSGIIDLAIVCACVGTGISDEGLGLRLVRFVVITFTVINNYFDQLNILLSGLLNGLKSIAYTITLLFLAILTFASLGYYYFSSSDPAHFGTFPLACITFFQMSTFENWSDILFINVYGCSNYVGAVYDGQISSDYINSNRDPYYVTTSFGRIALPICPINSAGNPAAATAIFCLYVIIAGFVIVSMCLAAVVIGITEKLETMNGKSVFGEESSHGEAGLVNAHRRLGSVKLSKASKLLGDDNKRDKSIEAMLQRILDTGSALGAAHLTREEFTLENLSHHSQVLRKKWYYLMGISCCLILDAILQIVDEVHADDAAIINSTYGWHMACNVLFTLEITNALLSYSMHIKDYPKNVWNIIDLVTTVILYIPLAYSSMSVLRFLRIFRLFKVLKTMSTYNIFVELSVVLRAISNSYICVIFVVFLITLFFLVGSIVGMILFKSSDPMHFGNFGNSFRTLFQIMTMDNWTFVMRVNMYGCKYFGFESGYATDDFCDKEKGSGLGYYSPIFFIIFVIISNMVLGSVFVGVIITSIDLLREDVVEEKAIKERLRKVANKYDLNDNLSDLMLDLFEMLDLSQKSVLVFEDLQPLLEAFGFGTDRQFEFFVKVDSDKSGQVDFAEFVEMMALMKYSRKEAEEDGTGKKGNRATKLLAGSLTIDFEKYFLNSKRLKGVSSINDPSVADIVAKVNPGRRKKQVIESSFSVSSTLQSFHSSEKMSGKVVPFSVEPSNDDNDYSDTKTQMLTTLDTSAAGLSTLHDIAESTPADVEDTSSAPQLQEGKLASSEEAEDRYRVDGMADGVEAE